MSSPPPPPPAEPPSSLLESHEIVSVSSKPFASLPLLLPKNLQYDPDTNSVAPRQDETSSSSSTTDTAHELSIVPNAGLEMIEQLPSPYKLSMISCVGPYRTGKSFLMSRFFHRDDDGKDEAKKSCFAVGPTLEGCTRGIWISTRALKDKDGVYKFLLDCQGMGDPEEDEDDAETVNARIALACLLISSVFVFNNSSHPDRGSLQFLRYLATIRKRMPQTTTTTITSSTFSPRKTSLQKQEPQHPEQQQTLHHLTTYYPCFLWVFRDFFLQLPKRRDTGVQYTLKEYMLERVLMPTSTSPRNAHSTSEEDVVVESLLNDFKDLQVLKVGYPKRNDMVSFSPEELSQLDDIPWDTLEETFRTDIENVIDYCLGQATPFSLGQEEASAGKKQWSWNPMRSSAPKNSHATGKQYAKWCEQVVALIHSDGVLPNIPNLQHQLLQSIADEQLAVAISDYRETMRDYLDSCPVYNTVKNGGTNGDTTTLASQLGPNGIAESDELIRKSSDIVATLEDQLKETISSASILAVALDDFKKACHDDSEPTSHLSRLQDENFKRSKTACEALIHSLYDPIRTTVREEPKSLKLEQFEGRVSKIREAFSTQARGPATTIVLEQSLDEPVAADRLMIQKVSDMEKELSQYIEEKEELLRTMQDDYEKALKRQQEEKAAAELEHQKAMERALEEQNKQRQEELSKLQTELEIKLKMSEDQMMQEKQQKEEELERLKAEAEAKLQAEIKAREERLRKEQESYAKEMETLRASADEAMTAKLQAAEERRRKEQEQLDREMRAKIEQAEKELEDKLVRKEAEISRIQEEMERREKEKQELLDRIEKAESQACPQICCCM